MADEVSITVSVDDRQLQEFFIYAGYKVRDMREPLTDVLHEIIFRNLEEQFDGNGILAGGWEPLTDAYFARKHADPLFAGEPTLVRTGEMREYLLGMFPEKPYHITRSYLLYDPHHIERVEWHQHGVPMRNPGGDLPARPIMTWSEANSVEAGHIFESWLDDLREYNARRSGSATRPGSIPNIIDFIP